MIKVPTCRTCRGEGRIGMGVNEYDCGDCSGTGQVIGVPKMTREEARAALFPGDDPDAESFADAARDRVVMACRLWPAAVLVLAAQAMLKTQKEPKKEE